MSPLLTRMMDRLRLDAREARHRFALLLSHPASIVALEVGAGLTALVWGLAVVGVEDAFAGLPPYSTFGDEAPWGAYFIVLGVVSLYAALTRSARTRLIACVVVILSFSQLVTSLWEGGGYNTGVFAYGLWGMVVPLVPALRHLFCAILDDMPTADDVAPQPAPPAGQGGLSGARVARA